MPMSVVEKYKQKGVQPRLVDIYKGMGVFEVPADVVVVDDINNQYFDGDIAADTYHQTDTDVQLLRELGVRNSKEEKYLILCNNLFILKF